MPNQLSFSRPPGLPTSAADDLRYWATHPLAGADPHPTAPALNRAAVRTLRLLGWLAALGAVLTGVAIVMPTLATAAADSSFC